MAIDNNMSILMVNVDDEYISDLTNFLCKKGLPVTHVVSGQAGKYDIAGKELINIDSRKLMNYESLAATVNGNETALLDEAILKELYECESMFLAVSDSQYLCPSSFRDRRKLYIELCRFWSQTLQENKFVLIFFPYTPSNGWDIVLFYIAKYLNIKTVILTRTTIKDRVLLQYDYRHIDKVPDDYLSDKTIEQLKKIIDSELLVDLDQQSSWTRYSNDKNREALKKRRGGEKTFLHRALSKIKNNNSNGFKELLKPSRMSDGCSSVLSKLMFYKYVKKIKKLRKYYSELAAPQIDYGAPYIFYALHCEPGRTTQPEGGVFEDQYLAIALLSKSLPENWRLYVKEHPRQFENSHTALKQLHYRNKNDYDRINKLRNVDFVNVDEDSITLIKNAKLVATITGSVGWQALMLGKKCITFGFPWYAACNSCYAVKSYNDCILAINNSVNAKQHDVTKDLLRFVQYLSKKMIVGSTRTVFARMSDTPYEELVQSPVNELQAIYEDTISAP